MNLLVTRIAILIMAALLLNFPRVNEQTGTPSSGQVITTGNMTAVRFDHAAALLASGQVLIVGGIERNGVMQSSAELFDPVSGLFRATGKLQSPHGWGLTATRLNDGKVLVAGGSSGCDSPCYTASAELYDPAAGKFLSTGSMTVPRAGARALLLTTGEVLLVGGIENSNSAPFMTAELYHPATGTFSPAGATHLRDVVQLVALRNGKVLVVGSSGAELYDPLTKHFTATGSMTIARGKFGAAVLPDGQVLIAGGQTGGPLGERVTSTQIYNPATGRFAPGPELNLKRFKLTKAVVALKDGRVLIAGGADQPEVYDPVSQVFHPVRGSKLDGFCFSTATVLSDGRVLLAGGYARPGSAGVNHAWLYEPGPLSHR